MAQQKKAPTRAAKTSAAKSPAAKRAPAKTARTAKAASAKNADVTSMAVSVAEAAASQKAPETAKLASTKAAEASAVLLETVEAIKAVAEKAADTTPAATAPVEAFKAAAPAAQAAIPTARLLEVGTERAREAYSRAQATTEQLRNAVTETATATTRGALEVNDKVLDALRAQSDAAFDLWRSTLTAASLPEAFRLQTAGARQVYETAAAHWRDVAETTTRVLGASMKPMQSAWTSARR